MHVSDAWQLAGQVARAGFEIAATFVVWICIYWQIVIVRDTAASAAEICGTGAAMLTLALGALWGGVFTFLAYDLLQAYRRRLTPVAKLLRIFPAAVCVVAVPTLLLLR